MELKGLERLGDNSESFDNKIALCKDCHSTQDYHTTNEDYLKLIKNPNLSKKILKRHNELKSKKDELEMKNDAYNKFIELKNNECIDKKRVSNIKDQQLSILSSKINIEMNRLNNIIYKEENNIPILSFSKKIIVLQHLKIQVQV